MPSDKKYIYTIGYGSYEESEISYLWHKEKIGKRRLQAWVHEAAIAVLDKRLRNEDYDYVHNYQDIHDDVVSWLVENKGFTQVEVQNSWSCFGWPSIFALDGWKLDRGRNINALTRAVNKAGFDSTHDSHPAHDIWYRPTVKHPDISKPHCCLCWSKDKLRAVRRYKHTMPDGTVILYLPEWMCLECRKVFKGKFKYTKTKPG